jgi:hypothetical protein
MVFGFSRPTYELSIFKNRLRLRDPSDGSTSERSAVYLFSTDRVLMADRECFEAELSELIRTHKRRLPLFFGPNAHVIHVEWPLVPVERAALRESLAAVGFSKIVLPVD